VQLASPKKKSNVEGCWVVCSASYAVTSCFSPSSYVLQTAREKVYQQLKTKLDNAIRSRTKGDEKFQAFVAEEIASIKNAIRKEQDVRQGCRCSGTRCLE